MSLILSILILQITDPVTSTLTIAEGISTFGMMAIAAAAFIIFAFIIIYVFIKLFNKMFDDMQKNQKSFFEKLVTLGIESNKKLDLLKESLTGEEMVQALTVAEYIFNYNKHQLIVEMANIKEKNHLNDREAIEKRLKLKINNLQQRRLNDLDKFTYKGHRLSYYTEPSWGDSVFNYVIDFIYDNREYNRDYYIRLFDQMYEQVKNEFEINLKTK